MIIFPWTVCDWTWDNTDLPDLPHRCVIRLGWHIKHCCHCGAVEMVTGEENVRQIRLTENSRD